MEEGAVCVRVCVCGVVVVVGGHVPVFWPMTPVVWPFPKLTANVVLLGEQDISLLYDLYTSLFSCNNRSCWRAGAVSIPLPCPPPPTSCSSKEEPISHNATFPQP